MEINVLIRTDMDSDFNFSTSIEGIYTNLKRKELEKEWVQKGKELVPEHIQKAYEYYSDLKTGKIMGGNTHAVEIMRNRRMENCAYELGKLEGIHTDEEYKNYYAKCLNLSWEKHLLVE